MKTNLQKAIDFLWANKEKYRDAIRQGAEPIFNLVCTPLCGGLPAEIRQQLDNYEVDAISDLWSQLLEWDIEKGVLVIGFKNKSEYYSTVKKSIKERIKNRKEDIILGDFLAWAKKNGWWLRGFESIHKSFVFNKDGTKKDGWSFQWATQCGFVSDEDIRKVIPKKTASQWDCWGR